MNTGGYFGWPWSYFGPDIDARVEPQRPERATAARVPDYALGAHTSSPGLAFHDGTRFPTSGELEPVPTGFLDDVGNIVWRMTPARR